MQLQEPGQFKLPKTVVDAYGRVTAASKLVANAPQVKEALVVEDELVEKLQGSSLSHRDAADVGTTIAKAEVDERAASAAQRVLRRVLEDTERAFATATRDNGETIIAEALRPALEEVLAEARTCAKLLEHYGRELSADMFLASPDEDREAYVRLQHAAQRYSAIRRAQSILGFLGVSAEADTAGRFSELKNIYALWPSIGSTMGTSKPPWPLDPVARMLWLVTSGAEPWLPTPAEQAAAALSWAEGNRARTAAALGGVATA